MLVYCGLDERLTGTGATKGLVGGGGDDVTELEGVGGLQQVTGGGRGHEWMSDKAFDGVCLHQLGLRPLTKQLLERCKVGG